MGLATLADPVPGEIDQLRFELDDDGVTTLVTGLVVESEVGVPPKENLFTRARTAPESTNCSVLICVEVELNRSSARGREPNLFKFAGQSWISEININK